MKDPGLNFSKFIKRSSMVLVLFALLYLGVLDFLLKASEIQKESFLIGFLIAYGNALLGYGILSWGYSRAQKEFLMSVFGGMFFRILLIFSLLFILIKAFKISQIYLLVSLIIFYFIFLILEIFEVHKNAQRSSNIV